MKSIPKNAPACESTIILLPSLFAGLGPANPTETQTMEGCSVVPFQWVVFLLHGLDTFFDNLVSNAHSFKVLLSLSKEVNSLMVTCNNATREMSICDMSICGNSCSYNVRFWNSIRFTYIYSDIHVLIGGIFVLTERWAISDVWDILGRHQTSQSAVRGGKSSTCQGFVLCWIIICIKGLLKIFLGCSLFLFFFFY